MPISDLSFIETGRRLEVETIEGGRVLAEFTNDPQLGINDEEYALFGRSFDDMIEQSEIMEELPLYESHASKAFRQRGLIYPFRMSDSRTSLEIIPGNKKFSERVAELSAIISRSGKLAKDFEKRAFNTIHRIFGGWGVCVGDPRTKHKGISSAIERFRKFLKDWEIGNFCCDTQDARTGDRGADGFLFLGRYCCGPIIFFQAKNIAFNPREMPHEFLCLGQIIKDWFGKNIQDERNIIPVYGVNSVLTLEQKSEISNLSSLKIVIIDAVDILLSDFFINQPMHKPKCIFM
jgi:hypothetical protein